MSTGRSILAHLDKDSAKVVSEVAKTVNAKQLLGLPSVWDLNAKIEWLVQGMIPLNAVTLISAKSGTGKTWLAYAIAGAVAHGTKFLGLETRQRPVVYLDGENPLAVAKRNIEGLGVPRTNSLEIGGGWNESPPKGPGDPELLALAKEHRPLLIFDSLIHFHGGEEQSASETRKYMNLFRALAHAGATVIVLHHPGKDVSKKYRGSSDIEASVDVAYTLEGRPRDGKLGSLTLRCFKSRVEAGRNFSLEFRSEQGFVGSALKEVAQRASTEASVSAIIAAHPEGINGLRIRELAKEQGLGKNAVYEFLKTWPQWKAGRGKEKLYLPREPTPAEEVRAVEFPKSLPLESGNTGNVIPPTPGG